MKQLDSLHQTGSVAEYQSKFEHMARSLLLYNPSYDDVFFVTRFLSGLKEEIRAPIILHRPPTLEVAGTLALLQEAELEANKSKFQSKADSKDSNRFQSKTSAAYDKSKFRRDRAKQVYSTANESADKLGALKAYRRANNLCFTCGEKWTGKNHKCPPQVPLHIIQELMDAVHIDQEPDYDSSEEDSEASLGQVVMVIQQAEPAVESKNKNRTLRLRGFIGKQKVLILVDSGSARTFVSQDLAAHIQQEQAQCESLQFTAADGSKMLSDQYIPQLQWHISGQKLKGLLKKKAITHVLELQALCPLEQQQQIPQEQSHSVFSVSTDPPTGTADFQEVADQIGDLLKHNDHLFQEPTDLPPQRTYDHKIPLITGAQPVNVRPYRYAPMQKDEIERQVDELLDELAGASYFSKLVCRSGYHQIRVEQQDEMKTAFRTHSGLYQFKAAMNTIFAPLLRKYVLVFMDDIFVYSKSMEDHIIHLQQVLQILEDNNFLLKRSKCLFGQQALEYLGHIISKDGVATEPSKISAISANSLFVIETDASDIGMGAVLMRDGHPISFFSKAFCPRNQALSTYEKECLAILMVVDKWTSYLHGKEFILKTGHRSLRHLIEQKVTSRLQQKALPKLMDLQYKIQFKKGSTNAAADALSRTPQLHPLLAISISTPTWLERLQQGYNDDADCKQLLVELSLAGSNDKGFSLVDGIIKHKGRIWVGNNTLAQQHIL
ncbi:uncharacterized protein [Miscanthus floridulus]|uniref:uncharacterized protein n=1 Tax=Miscanthus floridulus TaxID=154761 RepID=UPI003458C6D0